jgi:predicted deacylase
MRYLKMLEGAPHVVGSPVWIERISSVTSDVNGLFYPLVKRGSYVQNGMTIGYVTDYLGKRIFDAKSPDSGVVLYICAVPSMVKGNTIANIGVPAR